mgnify:FL=1
MKKQNNYIRYFAYNVDEVELYAYINEAIFDLIELTNMSENDIYKKYNFSCNSLGEQKDRKVLYNMLLDIDKIDSNIVYDNFYLSYFKRRLIYV